LVGSDDGGRSAAVPLRVGTYHFDITEVGPISRTMNSDGDAQRVIVPLLPCWVRI
jgi:hypothetical protein